MLFDHEHVRRVTLKEMRGSAPEYHRGVDWKWIGVWALILVASLVFWWMVITGITRVFAHHESTIPAHSITLR